MGYLVGLPILLLPYVFLFNLLSAVEASGIRISGVYIVLSLSGSMSCSFEIDNAYLAMLVTFKIFKTQGRAISYTSGKQLYQLQ